MISKQTELEECYTDLDLEIEQNTHRDYDVYMFGIIKYRNVPSLKVVEMLLGGRCNDKQT